MKNNDKSNLNDKDLENISGGNIENKEPLNNEKIQEMFKNRDWRPIPTVYYGGPNPRRRWERLEREMEEKRKKQDEKEGAEPLLPATPDKEDK